MSSLSANLSSFMDQFISLGKGNLPSIEQDSDWPSPCEQGNVNDEGNIKWRPVAPRPKVDFSDMEQALELELHQDIKTYFGSYFSDGIDATTEQGNLQLLFAWSQQDFERLQQNIIGHVLVKRRLKQGITIFFAVTDEEDWILSVDNATGQVMLETPGKEAEKVVAENLADFIASLTPIFPG